MMSIKEVHRFSIAVIVVLIALLPDAVAQTSGFGNAFYLDEAETTNIFDVKFADIDGDGLNDIIAGSAYHINWYKNLDAGEFGSSQTIVDLEVINSVSNILSFDVGDVDDDGDLDLAWTTFYRLNVNLNDGEGKLQETYEYKFGRNTHSVSIGESNNEHSPRIYVISGEDGFNELSISEGELIKLETKHPDYRSFSLINIMKDDFDDFINISDHFIRITLNAEDGSESTRLQIPRTSTANTISTNVYTGDINNDNSKDVLIATEVMHNTRRPEMGILNMHKYQAGGSFSEPIAIDTVSLGFSSAAMLDVDNDGLKDIVAASLTGSIQDSEIYWYKNLSSDNFAEAEVLVPTGHPFDKVYDKDIDDDGYTDLLAISATGDEVVWFRNNHGNSFEEKRIIGSSGISSPRNIVSFDVNQDGLNDIIIGSESGEKAISWYKNLGDFKFEGPIIIDAKGETLFDLTFSELQYADLNNDGLEDLITLNTSQLIRQEFTETDGFYFESFLLTYLNQGLGTFGAADTIEKTHNRNMSIATGDFDGDGDKDIFNSSPKLWFENSGDGSFDESGKELSDQHLSPKTISADFDADGMDEIISHYLFQYQDPECEGLCRLEIFNRFTFYNIGSDSTTDYKFDISFSKGPITDFVPAEINGDEFPEVIAVQNDVNFLDTKSLASIEIKKDSVWNITYIDSSQQEYNDVFSADIDNDGDEDIVTISEAVSSYFDTSYREGKIFWYENDGTGSFTKKPYVDSLQIDMQQVIASDLNNDGLLEIITLLAGEEKIFIYPNEINGPVTSTEAGSNSPKSFVLHQNYPNPFNPTTTISYSVPAQSFVNIRVYNLLGQLVQTLVDERQPAGAYQVKFDASSLSSGIYFYRLKAGDNVINKKMILLK